MTHGLPTDVQHAYTEGHKTGNKNWSEVISKQITVKNFPVIKMEVTPLISGLLEEDTRVRDEENSNYDDVGAAIMSL